jgi:hypothetical protein
MKIKTILLLLALCVTMGVSSQGRIEPGNEVAIKLYKEAAKKEKKNPAYSLAMYESLAKDGYAPAQYIMYKKGKGDKWLELAAVGGHFEAATGNGFLSQRIKQCEQVVERSRACATRASNGEPISEQEIEMLWDESLVFDQVYRQMESMQGYLFSATIAKDVNFFPPYYKGKKDMQKAQWDLEALCRISRDELAQLQMEFGQQMDIIKASAKKTAMTASAGTQMRYHDVEYHEAKGKVKSITTNDIVFGQPKTRTIEFTVDGKQIGVTDAEYDSNGYRIKSTDKIKDITTTSNYVWENGRIVKSITSVNGMSLTSEYTYNAKGEVVEASKYMGSAKNTMKIQYSDYKYDSRGNWISRKERFMNEQMTETRTIVYY